MVNGKNSNQFKFFYSQTEQWNFSRFLWKARKRFQIMQLTMMNAIKKQSVIT